MPQGSVFGVIGPNRAGKTTLVKALSSLCRPTSGTILRLGRPVQRPRHAVARVGYLHESQAFPRYLTARVLLRYYGRLSFVASASWHSIPRLLEQVGLADLARRTDLAFSKGMVQRLALAQALVNDPELLVLDEPTEGMDLLARKTLARRGRPPRGGRKTRLFVSHSLADVQRLCDRVAVLRAAGWFTGFSPS